MFQLISEEYLSSSNIEEFMSGKHINSIVFHGLNTLITDHQ